jgi:hypothetical protein
MTSNFNHSALDSVMNKIQSISWKFSDDHVYSNAKLLQEHFHRLALWCEALGDFSRWPSSDIMYMIMHRKSDDDAIEKIQYELDRHAPYLSYSDLRAWERWFHWQIIHDYALETHPSLPDAFEPLIRMYERGGAYYTEHGYAFVGKRGVQIFCNPPDYYVNNSFVSALDDVSLNRLDISREVS